MTDLDRPLTVREFREFRAELEARFATKDDLHALREELRTHFDMVAESFRDQFANLYDWTLATTTALGNRTMTLEVGQRTLETRGSFNHASNGPRRICDLA